MVVHTASLRLHYHFEWRAYSIFPVSFFQYYKLFVLFSCVMQHDREQFLHFSVSDHFQLGNIFFHLVFFAKPISFTDNFHPVPPYPTNDDRYFT